MLTPAMTSPIAFLALWAAFSIAAAFGFALGAAVTRAKQQSARRDEWRRR